MAGIDEPDNPEDYRGFRITSLHAICAIDPDNDSEGIGGFMSRNGPIPMIASDKVRLDQLEALAQEMANQDGMSFRVVRFSMREDLKEILPQDGAGGLMKGKDREVSN